MNIYSKFDRPVKIIDTSLCHFVVEHAHGFNQLFLDLGLADDINS